MPAPALRDPMPSHSLGCGCRLGCCCWGGVSGLMVQTHAPCSAYSHAQLCCGASALDWWMVLSFSTQTTL